MFFKLFYKLIINDLIEKCFRVISQTENMTMRSRLSILFIGFLFLLSFNLSAQAQENTNLTIIKEWQKEDNLNGGFEALRRDWLAKVREIRQKNTVTTKVKEGSSKIIKIKAKDIAIANNNEQIERIIKP